MITLQGQFCKVTPVSILYDKAMYKTDPVPSYWEDTISNRIALGTALTSDVDCDVAIIGGGYTGLSTALHLARDHDVDVRVLEAGSIGWGASGRNGGFNCLPATKMSIAAMIKKVGLDETKRFWAAQLDGVDLTTSLATEEGIDYDRQGDGNFEVAHRSDAYVGLVDYGKELSDLFGIKTTCYDKSEFAEVGYESTEQYGALHIQSGFALNPLKYALGIGKAAQRHGAKLHPYSEVGDWQKKGNKHILITPSGTITANKVVMATNGFTREGLHKSFDKRLLPVLSNIVVTRPLSDDEMAAQRWKIYSPICNSRKLLFYYRMLEGNRFMIGARGDMTGKPEDGDAMRAWMGMRIGEVFPAWRDAEITHFWRGFVCMTQKFAPSMGQLDDDPSVYFGYGYHANGVNTAPWAGRLIANILVGKSTVSDIPVVMRGNAQKFPFAGLRLWYLRAAKALYHWQDEH